MAVASSAYKKVLEGDQQPKEVLVKIERVTKKFDETIAVDDVSLEIRKGEIWHRVVVGPFNNQNALTSARSQLVKIEYNALVLKRAKTK